MVKLAEIPKGGIVREPESCPGHLTWSAFGAHYPDTVCSSVLDWTGVDDAPGDGWLCDADDDFRCKDIPCPFCNPRSFSEYLWEGGYIVPTCATCEQMLPAGTPIDFHDGQALSWTATCPTDGRCNVLARDYLDTMPEADIPNWFAVTTSMDRSTDD